MGNDLTSIFTWWFQFFVIGLIFLPLTCLIFKNFFDRAYAFSKILGLLLSSYLVWLLSSLKILPFSQVSILIVLGLFLILNLVLLKINFSKIIDSIKKLFTVFIFEELLFFLGLFFWSFVRAHEPSINGLEKFMDFGFVNSILRTKYFPPLDMWLSGKGNFINYYYFGHYVCAFLTKLSGIDSTVTYNLRLADLLGLSLAATFSLTGNLINSTINDLKVKIKIINEKYYIYLGGLLGAIFLNFAGNLHAIIYATIKGAATYWYPDATRYIPYTIHEFPLYSYVVSDLHGHLSDIPFVLLTISLMFILFKVVKNSPSHIKIFMGKKFGSFRNALYQHSILILLSLVLAVNAMTNFWDLPIYLLLIGSIFLYFNYKKYGLTFTTVFETAIPCIILLVFYFLFALPFNLKFVNFSKGIAPVFSHSAFYQLLVLWGFFYFFTISFLIFLYGNKLRTLLKPESLVKGLSEVLGVNIKIAKSLSSVTESNLIDTDIFVLILIGLSTFLIIFPELLYIKDIYIKEYHRANTMFKLVYQSFMMLSVVAAYVLIRIKMVKKNKTFLSVSFFIVSLIFIFSVLIYPYFAINSYYNGLKNYQGLNGIKYLETKYPSDYKGLIWIKNNIKDQSVILEAVGESYTDYSRISANTGIPTVLGWPVHEWLWRGSYDEAGKRTAEVQTMYTSNSLSEVERLLKFYQVKYIFLGTLEKQKYQNINEDNFKKLGKVVFSSGETKIYRLNSKSQ